MRQIVYILLVLILISWRKSASKSPLLSIVLFPTKEIPSTKPTTPSVSPEHTPLAILKTREGLSSKAWSLNCVPLNRILRNLSEKKLHWSLRLLWPFPTPTSQNTAVQLEKISDQFLNMIHCSWEQATKKEKNLTEVFLTYKKIYPVLQLKIKLS